MPGEPSKVLVTRPEPGASKTVRRLEELGFTPIKLPLHEIRALPARADAIPVDAAAIAVTSANAIRHASRGTLERLTKLRCFAIGATTAMAARTAGFTDVVEGGGDAEAVAGLIVEQKPAGMVVYLCGKVRRPQFERRLTEGAVTIVPVETYDATPIVRGADEILSAIGSGSIDYTLVYSAGSAEALAGLMTRADLRGRFENTGFLCISRRTADVLAGGMSGKILVAREPSETALLSLLRQTAGCAP